MMIRSYVQSLFSKFHVFPRCNGHVLNVPKMHWSYVLEMLLSYGSYNVKFLEFAMVTRHMFNQHCM